MRTLRNVIVLLLAITWMPLTSHCSMEVLPGFEFLRCLTDDAGSSKGGDPCDDGGCCAIESAHYQAPRPQETAPPLPVVMLAAHEFVRVEFSTPAEIRLEPLISPPPELPVCWRFYHRAVLPIRAPSHLS